MYRAQPLHASRSLSADSIEAAALYCDVLVVLHDLYAAGHGYACYVYMLSKQSSHLHNFPVAKWPVQKFSPYLKARRLGNPCRALRAQE